MNSPTPTPRTHPTTIDDVRRELVIISAVLDDLDRRLDALEAGSNRHARKAVDDRHCVNGSPPLPVRP